MGQTLVQMHLAECRRGPHLLKLSSGEDRNGASNSSAVLFTPEGVCPEGPESGESIQGKPSREGGAEAKAGVAFLIGLFAQSPVQAGTWQISGG